MATEEERIRAAWRLGKLACFVPVAIILFCVIRLLVGCVEGAVVVNAPTQIPPESVKVTVESPAVEIDVPEIAPETFKIEVQIPPEAVKVIVNVPPLPEKSVTQFTTVLGVALGVGFLGWLVPTPWRRVKAFVNRRG